MNVTRKSMYSGEVRTMDLPVTQEHLDSIEQGALIQDVLPFLEENIREFIMSGITSEEWDSMWEERFDDDDDEGLEDFGELTSF